MVSSAEHRIVVAAPKSVGGAVFLAFLFGPLGMLYATVFGAFVMFILSVLVAFFTFGVGLIFTWPLCMIWAGVGASHYNHRLMHLAAAYGPRTHSVAPLTRQG